MPATMLAACIAHLVRRDAWASHHDSPTRSACCQPGWLLQLPPEPTAPGLPRSGLDHTTDIKVICHLCMGMPTRSSVTHLCISVPIQAGSQVGAHEVAVRLAAGAEEDQVCWQVLPCLCGHVSVGGLVHTCIQQHLSSHMRQQNACAGWPCCHQPDRSA